MYLIQNLACIPVSFQGKDVRLKLEKTELKNKWINSYFILSSEEDSVLLSPYNQDMITQLFDNEHLRFRLYFTDIDKKTEANSAFFSIRNYNLRFQPASIESVTDINAAEFISHSSLENAGANTLLYFSWQNRPSADFFHEMKDFAAYEFTQQANTEKKFSEIITDNKPHNKIIKKITIFTTDSYSPSLLDIVCKDGRRMEFVPASLLQLPDEYGVFFENIEIDFEKSRFLIPTFNEKEYSYKITFGW